MSHAKSFRGRARTVASVVHPNFYVARIVGLANDRDVFQLAAGVLNFAPAEIDLALNAAQELLLALFRAGLGNMFRDKILRAVE